MACNSNTNSCPAHPGYIPGITPTTWTDDPLSSSITDKSIHHNQLRTAISAELTRRSKSWPVDPGAVSTATTISYLHPRRLRDGINAAKTWSYPAAVLDIVLASGVQIFASANTALRSQINIYEAECVCDCNYCTCDCNHSCTCDCDYSDERLKKDIIYM